MQLLEGAVILLELGLQLPLPCLQATGSQRLLIVREVALEGHRSGSEFQHVGNALRNLLEPLHGKDDGGPLFRFHLAGEKLPKEAAGGDIQTGKGFRENQQLTAGKEGAAQEDTADLTRGKILYPPPQHRFYTTKLHLRQSAQSSHIQRLRQHLADEASGSTANVHPTLHIVTLVVAPFLLNQGRRRLQRHQFGTGQLVVIATTLSGNEQGQQS